MPVTSALTAVLLGVSLTAPGVAPLLRIQDPALLESSGLAVSARHDGVLWTHADGGRVAEVRALDAAGETVATVTLAGVDPFDPEALAPGLDEAGDAALFLGDLGDNDEVRSDVSVFRFAEPSSLRDQTVEATWFRFTYPDGPHDAEALLVHPRTGRILVATKAVSGAAVYRAPRDLVPVDGGTNQLVRVAGAPSWVTDGAYLPDGRFVLRTYASVLVYDRPGHRLGSAALPLQPQGESVAVDGDRLLVGSEGPKSAVYAVPVPATTAGPEPVPAGPPQQPDSPSAAWTPDPSIGVAGIAAAVVLLLAAVAYGRRGRRPRR